MRQPPGTNLCGQTCVAMLAGVPLEAAIGLVKSRGLTQYPQLLRALNQLGVACGEVHRTHDNVPAPGRYLVRVRRPGDHKSHFIVFEGHMVYDPMFPVPMVATWYWSWLYNQGWHISSYVPVVL